MHSTNLQTQLDLFYLWLKEIFLKEKLKTIPHCKKSGWFFRGAENSRI
jgi:hypothetical protein